MLRLPQNLRRGVRYAATATATSSSSSAAKFAPLAMKAAEEVSSKWKGTTANGGKTKNYIGGEFVESSASKWLEVRDPVRLS
jgi:malonate-semialdehyde dehydrogenase (acetylating)/methylmalonate-semialdehyde dehydrogenase